MMQTAPIHQSTGSLMPTLSQQAVSRAQGPTPPAMLPAWRATQGWSPPAALLLEPGHRPQGHANKTLLAVVRLHIHQLLLYTYYTFGKLLDWWCMQIAALLMCPSNTNLWIYSPYVHVVGAKQANPSIQQNDHHFDVAAVWCCRLCTHMLCVAQSSSSSWPDCSLIIKPWGRPATDVCTVCDLCSSLEQTPFIYLLCTHALQVPARTPSSKVTPCGTLVKLRALLWRLS